METGVRSARNELFQELKPRCVELSQLALRDDGSSINSKALIQSTNLLLKLLRQKCQRNDGVFDEKLADYVFFPLSQILRRKQHYTDNLSEVTIRCLRILLEYGWRNSIALDLAKQLLIMLTFAVGGVPGQESTKVPEELASEAYTSLAALFKDLKKTPGGAASLVETGTVPALGHCITVILDGVTEGSSVDTQLPALHALDAVWHCIKDSQALATFLPGTVSGLTKSLIQTSTNRRSRKFIIAALEVLQYALVSILSDLRTRNIKDSDNTSSSASKTASDQPALTKSWLNATAAQIKLALSNVVKLRSHEATDVRHSLNILCLTTLDECHNSLASSASILVETCLRLSEFDTIDRSQTTLVDLATIHTDVAEMIKSTVYNWVTALPRVMQSSDEAAKESALSQLSKAHNLLSRMSLDSSVVADTMANSLRDSVTVMQEISPQPQRFEEVDFDFSTQSALSMSSDNALSVRFRPVIMFQESQKKTRDQLLNLLANLGTEQSLLSLASEMLEYARNASGPSLVSSYWLSFQLVQFSGLKNEEIDEFISSAFLAPDRLESVTQELYGYSQAILSNPEERTSDWRLQAIALEVVATTAQRLKTEFRTELVDILYPVAQLIGSSNRRVREHAITCLNIISSSCNYSNVSALIVDNVDYMVNAISLRLNTFDISPQAPQILIMMIRLTGPNLLLYLDDVVESVFAALDNFHGYQKLVEVLFAVLGEIVDVGSRSDQLQITNTPHINHRKTKPPLPTIDHLIATLKKENRPPITLPHEPVPQQPWKSAKTLLDEAFNGPDDMAGSSQAEEQTEIAKIPPTKTYKMLQSISRLSQFYLTSSSPLLRSKLLSLITTSSLTLRDNEDQFLPLINDIWPVVVKRLYDKEPFVVIAAAEAIAGICKGGSDFLGTRVRTEWSDLMKMARRAKEAEKKGSGDRGAYSQVSKIWEAVVQLLLTILEYVRVQDEMFDEVLELLEDLFAERSDVRTAFKGVNADAVWLVLLRKGEIGGMRNIPVLKGYKFAGLDSC